MMMKRIGMAVIALSVTLLVSCKDEQAQETEATPTQSEVETDQNPKTTAKVNPQHGLPGHRCDLPVGAPLDSEANAQPTTPTNQPPSTNVSPIRVEQTPKINPPHGEPGHDCAVPVGAELKQQ